MSLRRLRPLLAVGVTLGLLLWVFHIPFSVLGSANLALNYALVAISLVILTGWVGQISLAQASFVGLGAFLTGVLVRSWGLNFPLTLLASAGITAAAAAALGTVALRVRGLYLAVATLIFSWMTQGYLFNQPWLAGTGGSASAPAEPLGERGSVPYLDLTDRKVFYFVMLGGVVVALVGAANLRDSKTGRAFFAIKGSEVAAASLGIDVTRYKLLAFAVSGFLAGAAGNLVMTHQQVVSASSFAVETSLFYLAIAVVGGLTSLPGAVASGVLFASLEEVFFRVEALSGLLLIVSASLLVVVLLFFPAGLAGVPSRLRELAARLRPVDRIRGLTTRRSRQDVGDAPADEDRGADDPAVAEVVDDAGGEDALVPDGATEDAPVPEDGDGSPITRGTSVASRLGAWVGRRVRRRDHGLAPDALSASLQQAAQEPEDQAGLLDSLVYVPGTASKVRLPARRRREPVLRASEVTVQFGGLSAVSDFELEVREGEIVALIGPNGAGKTTLFNAISGLNEPTSGLIELFDVDVTRLPVQERARRGMARTFQVIQLFPELSVFENLLVASHHRNPTGFFAHLAATPMSVAWEATARMRVHQVVELVGLHEHAHRPVAGLPFGVLRLVELARALVTGAPFLMLDEPASGLDNTETDRFMDLLLWVRQTLGVTMLLIEHDIRVVMGLADHVYVIEQGRRIASGTPTQVQRDPKVIAAYLGTAAEAEGSAKETKAQKRSPTPVRTVSTRSKAARTEPTARAKT